MIRAGGQSPRERIPCEPQNRSYLWKIALYKNPIRGIAIDCRITKTTVDRIPKLTISVNAETKAHVARRVSLLINTAFGRNLFK